MIENITLEAGIGIVSLTITILGLIFKLCSSKEKDGESPRNKDGDKPKKVLSEEESERIELLDDFNSPLYTQDYSKIHYNSTNTGPR